MEVLPTPIFFYGMQPGDEATIDLERGKTLVLRCLAISEPDDEGQVRVFYELNGQPRTVRIQDRFAEATAPRHEKAEEGNPGHVAAPMPGSVVTVAVAEGQKVKAGDVLLSIEAMKMESAIHAERDGTVARIVRPAGTQVEAKDLLIELSVG